MPHARKRHATRLLLKRLSFSPVVAVQGARQTGKSFLVRELLQDQLPKLAYTTLDRAASREFAYSNPETFLAQHASASPLVIDEAQKAPPLFDAIKYEIDRQKRPGSYLLLGSTEFSKLSLIRESLTGRMSRVRLYSMNAAETQQIAPNPSKHPLLLNDKPRISRAQWISHLERGGMPGVFAVRSLSERESLLRDWIDLTAQRDALLFPKVKADPNLLLLVLEKIATLEEPDAGAIAHALRRDLRRIKTHLEILKTLFVIHSLDPHPSGSGKTWYFLCDVAFAGLLGASFERRIHTWLLHEQLSQRSYSDERQSRLFYYRTPKGRIIHLVVESPPSSSGAKAQCAALKIFSEERVLERDTEILKAFARKNRSAKTILAGLGPDRRIMGEIEVFPWEALG